MTHLTTEQLLSIVEDPDNMTERQKAHLLECAECRAKLSQLQQTVEQFEGEAGGFQSAPSGVSEMTLANYFDGELDENTSETLKTQIQSKGALTKEALHFLTHTAAMSRSVETVDQTKPAEESKPTLLETVTGWLHQWQAPVWQTASASFAVALIIGVMFVSNPAPNNVVQFQNDSGLYWQLPQPGMGFFQLSTAEQEPFAGVNVSVLNNQLSFGWPEIEGVSEYQLQVQTLQHGNVLMVIDTTAGQTEVLESVARFELGQHYEWVLTGLAEDGRQFRAQGGFVMMGQ